MNVMELVSTMTQPVDSDAIASQTGVKLKTLRLKLRKAGIAYIRDESKVRWKNEPVIFEKGDEVNITGLFELGLTVDEVAEKWDTDADTLRRFCKRKGMPITRAGQTVSATKANQLNETGVKPSGCALRTIDMFRSGKTVTEISVMLGKSEHYVNRMIDIYLLKDKNHRHRELVNDVMRIVNRDSVTIGEAVKTLNITYSQYRYSYQRLDKENEERNKKN